MDVIEVSAGQRLPASQRFRFVPIAGSTLFEGLNPQELTVLCDLHVTRGRKDKDGQLVRAKDAAAPLLTIISGTAFRFTMLPNGGRQILSVYLPGDTIGLDTLVSGAPTYPVQCATAVTYAAVEHQDAVQLTLDASWFRNRALSALAHERATAELAIIRLGQCNAEQRVASFLLEMYYRLAERGRASNGEFTLELTQQHIADILGLTPVHLNRVLGRLRAQKLLTLNAQRVGLPNMSSLEFLAVLPYQATRMAS